MTRRVRSRRIGARFNDPSDGFAEAMGAMPDAYFNAADATRLVGLGGAIWPGRIGGNATEIGTLVHVSTGFGDDPYVGWSIGTSDAISIPSIAAKQAPDPDQQFVIANKINPVAFGSNRYLWSFGRAGQNTPRIAPRANSSIYQFYTVNDAGSSVDSITVGNLSNAYQWLVFSYGGSSGNKARLYAITSSGTPTRISSSGGHTLSTLTNATITDFHWGNLAYSTPVYSSGHQLNKLLYWSNKSFSSDSEMSDFMTNLHELDPAP